MNTKKVSLDEAFENFPAENESVDLDEITGKPRVKSGQESASIDDVLEEDETESEDEKETENDESNEDQEEDGEPSQGGEDDSAEEDDEVPSDFHKSPRFQRLYQELKGLRRTTAEQAVAIEDLKNGRNGKKEEAPEGQDAQLPKWWTDIAGNDDVAKNSFREMRAYMTEQAIKDMTHQLAQEAEETQKANQKLIDTIATNLKEVEDKFGVKLLSEESKKDRDEFLNYIEELAPKNAQGQINFAALPNFVPAYEAWKAKKGSKAEPKPKPNTIIKKKVASLTKQSSSSGSDAGDKPKRPNPAKYGWSGWREAMKSSK